MDQTSRLLLDSSVILRDPGPSKEALTALERLLEEGHVRLNVPVMSGENQYFSYASYLIAVSFVVWGLRVRLRMMFTQVASWSDAAKRVVAARTYKGVLQKGMTVSEEMRETMLGISFTKGDNSGALEEYSSPTLFSLLKGSRGS